MTTWDFVVVGTSPVCLLEACSLRAKGHSVLLIDEADRLGGAWHAVTAFGMDEVENGPHFLVYPGSIKFLQSVGLDVREVRPTFWITGDSKRIRRISYGAGFGRKGYNRFRQAVSALLAKLRPGGGGGKSPVDLFRSGWTLVKRGVKFSLRHRQSYYFWNGSGPAVRALGASAVSIGVDLRLKTRLASIEAPSIESPLTLNFADGDSVTTNKLLLTERAMLEKVAVGDENIELKYSPRIRTQLHFVARPPADEFCVARFFSTKFFLLSNLSDFSDRPLAPEGQALFTLALRGNGQKQIDKKTFAVMYADLQRLGVMGSDPAPEVFETSFVNDTRMARSSQRQLSRKTDKRIYFVGTRDLSDVVVKRKARWRRRGVVKAIGKNAPKSAPAPTATTEEALG